MNGQVTEPVEKPKLKGVEIVKALLKKQRFINTHISTGGTGVELEKMGYKFETFDLSNITSGKS